MESLPIKLTELSPLIIALIENIQSVDSSLTTKQQKLISVKELAETTDKLRHFFACKLKSIENNQKTKNLKDSFERAFSKFEWDANVTISKYDFGKYSENGKVLLSAILKELGMKGCGVFVNEVYLKLCLKIVNEMKDEKNKSDISNKYNFKLLLDGFLESLSQLKRYWHISFFPSQKNSIMLYLNQIRKILPLLLKMIKVENEYVKNFALKILEQCLSKIIEEIHSDGTLVAKNCGQEFITLINYTLYKLNDLANSDIDFQNFLQKAKELVEELKPMIDELLCYAMSIAQVTESENDYQTIILSSQKVLKNWEDFNNDINEENICMIKLNAASVGEKLCFMEQQVNTSVLRLVLEVFTGINSPLKTMINKCRTDIQKQNKALDDLNSLISDFDSEMDRIMQIGFFAISCTSDLNRILKIQSCLASLESLETELIPSLTALYLECNDTNKSNFRYLFDIWLSEITELKILIDSILDPAGFCGVVLNKIKEIINVLNNDLKITIIEPNVYSNDCLNKIKTVLNQTIRYSKKLINTLRTSFKDEDQLSEETETYVKNFQLAVQQCDAVLNLLVKEEDANNKNADRALKILDFLVSELNKLFIHLLKMESSDGRNSNLENTADNFVKIKIQIPEKNFYDLNSALESAQSKESTKIDEEVMTPYIDKGIMRSKRRQFLYTTPSHIEKEDKKNFQALLQKANHWSKTPVSKKRSRCCKPLNLNLELGNTIDFEITDILENLSQFSNSFEKNSRTNSSKSATNEKKGKDVGCETERNVEMETPKFTSRGCCANLIYNSISNNPEHLEKNSLGNRLRHNFLQSLNDLDQNSLPIIECEEGSYFDTPNRLTDLKNVEEKINFLKHQMPNMFP